VVDQTPFAPYPHPDIFGVKWVDDLQPYIERKLFTVNTGHAAAAYYGHNLGRKTIHEALADPVIYEQVQASLQETTKLIVEKHNIDLQEQKAYVEKIIKRISNPHLEDTVDRVGRAPLRKLSRKERFVGPASQLAEMGYEVKALLGAIEQAFLFQNVVGDDESKQLAEILEVYGPDEVVVNVCGLEKEHPLFSSIVTIVSKVQKGAKAGL